MGETSKPLADLLDTCLRNAKINVSEGETTSQENDKELEVTGSCKEKKKSKKRKRQERDCQNAAKSAEAPTKNPPTNTNLRLSESDSDLPLTPGSSPIRGRKKKRITANENKCAEKERTQQLNKEIFMDTQPSQSDANLNLIEKEQSAVEKQTQHSSKNCRHIESDRQIGPSGLETDFSTLSSNAHETESLKMKSDQMLLDLTTSTINYSDKDLEEGTVTSSSKKEKRLEKHSSNGESEKSSKEHRNNDYEEKHDDCLTISEDDREGSRLGKGQENQNEKRHKSHRSKGTEKKRSSKQYEKSSRRNRSTDAEDSSDDGETRKVNKKKSKKHKSHRSKETEQERSSKHYERTYRRNRSTYSEDGSDDGDTRKVNKKKSKKHKSHRPKGTDQERSSKHYERTSRRNRSTESEDGSDDRDTRKVNKKKSIKHKSHRSKSTEHESSKECRKTSESIVRYDGAIENSDKDGNEESRRTTSEEEQQRLRREMLVFVPKETNNYVDEAHDEGLNFEQHLKPNKTFKTSIEDQVQLYFGHLRAGTEKENEISWPKKTFDEVNQKDGPFEGGLLERLPTFAVLPKLKLPEVELVDPPLLENLKKSVESLYNLLTIACQNWEIQCKVWIRVAALHDKITKKQNKEQLRMDGLAKLCTKTLQKIRKRNVEWMETDHEESLETAVQQLQKHFISVSQEIKNFNSNPFKVHLEPDISNVIEKIPDSDSTDSDSSDGAKSITCYNSSSSSGSIRSTIKSCIEKSTSLKKLTSDNASTSSKASASKQPDRSQNEPNEEKNGPVESDNQQTVECPAYTAGIEMCTLKFDRSSGLNRRKAHLNRMHGLSGFKCPSPTCPNIFYYAKLFNPHWETNHKNEELTEDFHLPAYIPPPKSKRGRKPLI